MNNKLSSVLTFNYNSSPCAMIFYYEREYNTLKDRVTFYLPSVIHYLTRALLIYLLKNMHGITVQIVR